MPDGARHGSTLGASNNVRGDAACRDLPVRSSAPPLRGRTEFFA